MELQQIASKEVLLPLGMSLCFVGIVLRGFARSAHRAARLRHQHWLHERKPGEPESAGQSGWFEKNLSAIANGTTIAGVVISAISLFL